MASAWAAASLARLPQRSGAIPGAARRTRLAFPAVLGRPGRQFASAAPAAPDRTVLGAYSRKADLAKGYLQEYETARLNGNPHEALRMLQKASAAAQGVHVWLPLGREKKDSVVPLCALIPDFGGDAPRSELPVTVRLPRPVARPARVLAEGEP